MTSYRGAPDADLERVLAGRTVDGRPDLEPLTMLVRALASLDTEVPTPRGQLAALLADGFDPAGAPAAADDVPHVTAPVPARTRALRQPIARLAGLSLAAKVLLGGSVAAAAGVTSAAGAGVLPAPVQDGVGVVVEAVTPFEVPPGSPAGSRPEPASRPSATTPPSTPVGPPSTRPTPTQRPDAPGLTVRPVPSGPPSELPRRTARPEQAQPDPKRTKQAPGRPGAPSSRGVGPSLPTQQAPGRATEQSPTPRAQGAEKAPGQLERQEPQAPSPAAPRAETPTTGPQSVDAAGSEDAPARR